MIVLKIIRFRLPDQESAFCNIYNIISSYHLNYLVVNQRVKVLIQIMTASNLHLCYLDGNNTLYCIYIHIILKEIVSSIVSSSMLSWLKYYPLLQKSSKNKTLMKTISLDIFLNLELLWWIYFWFPVFNCLLKRTTQTTNVFMKKKKKNELIEVFQLRTNFQTVMVSCSRFIWITNSMTHRRIWTANYIYMKLLPNAVDHKG